MKTIKINRNKLLLIILLVFLAVFCKFFQYTFLSEKYFSDSTYILGLIANNIEPKGTAFWVTAEFYKLINVFNLSTIYSWSIFLTTIFTIYIIIMLCKKKDKYSFLETIFIALSFSLLNFFVFNLGKDIIQLIIFFIIYYIMNNNKLVTKKKIIYISIVLVLESVFFRMYYFIVLFGFILSYIFLNKYTKKIKDSSLISFFMKILIVFFMVLYLSSIFFPSRYLQLINARDVVTNLLSANTEIRNLIPNSYILNYIMNGIRILFPFELLFKSFYYVPFIIYQLMITIVYFKSTKKININNILLVSLLTGYNLGAFVFEPDFGSVIRHESVLFIFYLDLFIINRKRRISNEIEEKNLHNDN